MKLLICDDDDDFIAFEKAYIDNWFKGKGKIADVSIASTYNDAAASDVNSFDVVLLDIEFPGRNGLSLAKNITGQTFLIFVSAKTSYVYESIKLAPFRFVRKQFFESDLDEALSAVMEKLESVVSIRTKQGTETVYTKDVLYVEVFGNTLYLHTITDVYKMSGKLKDHIYPGFIQCHRSYCVNISHIKSVERDYLCLTNSKKIPVSRSKRETIKKYFYKNLLSGGVAL